MYIPTWAIVVAIVITIGLIILVLKYPDFF